jgi:hypothetical protein
MADDRDINALRHYVARLEDDLAIAENDVEDMRIYSKLQAIGIITLGQEVGRLREALTMFTMFYPFGISLELDQAFRTARAALGEEKKG